MTSSNSLKFIKSHLELGSN